MCVHVLFVCVYAYRCVFFVRVCVCVHVYVSLSQSPPPGVGVFIVGVILAEVVGFA